MTLSTYKNIHSPTPSLCTYNGSLHHLLLQEDADNFSQTASGGGEGKTTHKSGSQKRKERKLRQEKRGIWYVTRFFHRQGVSVTCSCNGKFWNINMLSIPNFVHNLQASSFFSTY
ncbi:hypothetical protein AMECASPLE_034636 [Ameca splendens]|uniref:Uncharacterized protein n=1 Tax=Ameca splendens TaxID=208324 RepID=A0ABV1A4P3_9TELE